MESINRKRSLEGITDHLEDTRLSSPRPKVVDSIKSFSLEAIFHPKFENENRDLQNIRQQMKSKVETNQGYLEVSLKHSGTLLLWSGGQRYYSKNSTANAFTYVGELLLRQHFWRAGASYQECSDYVEQNRLTLAFECVTSVLGHHGDLPKRDFLILTAIADRDGERFYSTSALLALSHKFRLPHNDVWIYSKQESAALLFRLYDTTRETGYATDTIQELDHSSDYKMSSMYPHVEFQGDILEGLVIRYVAYRGPKEIEHQSLETTAATSQQILSQISPSAPPSFDSELSKNDKLLSTDIRELYRQCCAESFAEVSNRLGERVLSILKETDSSGRRIARKRPNRDWNIPELAKEILKRSDIDNETRRIASVIEKAISLKANMSCGVYRENDSRWLCILHVLHDKSFLRYQNAMEPGDMHLFRGFCIEMGTAKRSAGVSGGAMEVEKTMIDKDSSDAQLMLKMKFLPYMVRTFICRNGIKTINSGGPAQFSTFCVRLMNQWNISPEAQSKWWPFFKAWGQYVHDVETKRSNDYVDPTLPPLNEAFYLDHVAHFTKLFEEGAIVVRSSPEFSNSEYRAMIVVVAVDEGSSRTAGERISKSLGGVRLKYNLEVNDDDFIEMRAAKGGGLVCCATIESRNKNLKKHLTKYGKFSSLVVVGCEDDEIDSLLVPQSSRLKGMTKGWKKMKFCKVISASVSVFQDGETSSGRNKEQLKAVLDELTSVSNSVPAVDETPGLLVFFPQIPGSGKSTLTNETANNGLKLAFEGRKREVVILMGDKFKGKYWPAVKSMRLEKSSTVFIADKNSPPNSWGSVGSSIGNGVGVAVLPDDRALSTTTIEGVISLDGEVDNSQQHHYPFSMSYLAICMARVLGRPAKSHPGKLDAELPFACWVVIKFFGFYRKITADELIDSVRDSILKDGGLCSTSPVRVPFFRKGLDLELPPELQQGIEEALKIQLGCEIAKKDPCDLFDKVERLQEIENKLRGLIKKHSDLLFAMTCDESESRKHFIDALPFQLISTRNTNGPSFVKIVSLDVPREGVHAVLKQKSQENSDLRRCLEEIGILPDNDKSSCLVRNTHVTMVHHNDVPQSKIHSVFDSLVGKSVSMVCKRVLWTESVAAIEVGLPSQCEDGTPMPPAKNDFQHITVWVARGTQAVASNRLPALLEAGQASVAILTDQTLSGTLSYWENTKTTK